MAIGAPKGASAEREKQLRASRGVKFPRHHDFGAERVDVFVFVTYPTAARDGRGQRRAEAGPFPRGTGAVNEGVGVQLIAPEVGGHRGTLEQIGADAGVSKKFPRGHERTRRGDVGLEMAMAVGEGLRGPTEGRLIDEAYADTRAIIERRQQVFAPGAEADAGQSVAGGVADPMGNLGLQLGTALNVFADLGPTAEGHAQIVAAE